MNKENLSTDVYMTTEHKRKQLKAKTSFSMVMNKVLVGAILLSTLATSTAPVYATSSSLKDKYNDLGTISSNYEVSVEGAIYNIKSITSAIETMKEKGTVNQDILIELASQINTLEKAVSLSGKAPTQAVIDTIKEVEQAVKGLEGKGAIAVEAALIATKQKLGIKTMEVESNNIKVENTKAVENKAVKLTDISTHWGKKNIEKLVGMGSISGYPDSTFRPNNTISFAEFLSISIKSVEKNVKASPQGTHWASGVYQTAIEKGILSSHEFQGTKEVFDAPISREDAALILIRINEVVQKQGKVDTKGTQGLIKDYSTIKDSRKDAVLQSYEKGLLSGKGTIGFDPKGSTTRAEASTIVVRLLDPSTRVKADAPPVIEDEIAYTKGVYTGRMRIEKATEYHLEALKTANFYTEGGKYYISIDLPNLPDGFKWSISADAYTKDGSYVFTTYAKDTIGVTGKQVIEVVCDPGKTYKDIDVATLSVYVFANDKVSESMVGHKLSTKAPNQVLRQSKVTSADASWETFNTKGIFNWK